MKGCGRWLGALALTLLLPAVALAADVKIGLMCPLTGKWASEGQDMKNIVSLLADEDRQVLHHKRCRDRTL